MKSSLVAALLIATPALAAAAASAPAASTPPAKSTPAASPRFPLKGVITAVLADKSALMVKHEAIPGVMRAMTMMFRVDAATLASAREGQAITAAMSREKDEWWLHNVRPVPDSAKKP